MPFPSNSDAVAQDQIRAFVERIMRMREEAKAINDDIREIYAEAKGNGFDKTVLGKVVLHVERRSTKAAEMLEAAALFDLYLEAIDGSGTRIALTHTHEADQSTAARKDARQGKAGEKPMASPAPLTQQGFATPDSLGDEVGRPQSATLQSEMSAGVSSSGVDTLEPAGTQAPPVDTNPVTPGGPPAATVAENVTVADQATEAAPQVSVAPSSRPLGTTVQDLSADAGTTSLPAEGDEARHQINAGGENVDHAAHNAGEADAASPAPAKRQWKHTDKPHADCLNPSQCGGFSNLGLCPGCKEAAAQGQVA